MTITPQERVWLTRVLVADSVWEDAELTVRDGYLYVEFAADDLANVTIPLLDERIGDK